ncbi:MAG: TRAP transporter permease [Bacteriovoracaceae bacterium]|nr:TRAP transporter permease [Bacteriovoracaceae bacterium]
MSRQTGLVASIIAASWSLFQLALPQFLLLGSELTRCIHLAFAICLVYLCFPVQKTSSTWANKIHWSDYILAVIAALASLYLAIDYSGIAMRQGMPIARDLFIGSTLVILLLEAARRSLGPALPTIAATFILYSFFSEHMPEIISFKNATISKMVNKLTMSTEGIYGVPLDVSTSTVFLFVLFGSMLNIAGGSKYFIDLAISLLGRFKGGPAKAAVLASGLTGMVSGSSIANTVTTGTFTIPLMKKTGFPGIKAGAIEVAASTNGQLMPPIMGAAAFIIAEYCHTSYFEVVKAAFIPAIISYIALIFITHLEASKLGLKGLPKEELPNFYNVFISGVPFLIPLCFLLYMLIIERYSAQLSVYYAIIVLMGLMVIQNFWMAQNEKKSGMWAIKNSLHQIWQSFVDGGKNMMSIGVAVASAGIIVGIVTLGLGNVITEIIDILAMNNVVLLLIITAIVSLILGMGLPTTANYIVMASLTAPAIVALSSNVGLTVPLIAAHLFCFYFGILADDTPPVGLAAYAAAAISKEDPIKTGIQGFIYDMRTAILPFMFIFNTDLLLINITSWWHIALIFSTGVIAMFAFASITQGYFLVKNRFYETVLLILCVLMLFRPDLFSNYIWAYHKFIWYGFGVGLYAITIFLQLLRKPKK